MERIRSIEIPPAAQAHTLAADQCLSVLETSLHGLTKKEAQLRLEHHGRNTLPQGKPASLLDIFFRQFRSPLIYVLLLAALVSLFLAQWSDAGFIFAVLLINAVIGTFQEFSAQRSAQALQGLVSPRARVQRDGEAYEIDAQELVPGDIVLLESGAKVPADLRLMETRRLSVDESLLTGESLPVEKHSSALLDADSPLGDRTNMAFAGTMVASGRAHGVVVATGLNTELGQIASSVLGREAAKPPLIQRMERFTHRIAIAVGGAALIVAAISLTRGNPLGEVFIFAVALAVSAIPEGLPVALTVALAVGMRRMAKRNVIVRRLVAVEALGSCTYIAADKTGTLTVNQLTVRQIQFPDQPPWEVTGEGIVPEGTFIFHQGTSLIDHEKGVARFCRAVVLANEGLLAHRDGTWVGHGDTADIALLVMAHKAGISQLEIQEASPQIDVIPYESERRFSASLNEIHGKQIASVKGAVETVLDMCSNMAIAGENVPLEAELVHQQAQALAADGYRVLAVADGEIILAGGEIFSQEHLRGLTFIGLVGMIDPLRPEVYSAVEACHRSGIRVAMVTGDHPATAFAIARALGLAHEMDQVVTGPQLAEADREGRAALDALCDKALVFSRMEPQQKLQIVESLQRGGHFVAVTGDGVNDAPALRAAQVGVAMGKSGTDVARETADLVIADDNFASIVAGIEEGRIAYGNIRKVIFLLISTGAAEIVLFGFALFSGAPLPLIAVQLLWLNLVTNGIQDVALAFEPAEGDELDKPPRPPQEPIFNRIMIERVILSSLVIGGVAYVTFIWMLGQGYSVDEARNGILLLMVLFENVQAFNSRSETRSVFHHNPLRNRLLFFGTLLAQLVHIGAMYTPGVRDVLHIQPISPEHWLELSGLALLLLLAMELHKWYRRRIG